MSFISNRIKKYITGFMFALVFSGASTTLSAQDISAEQAVNNYVSVLIDKVIQVKDLYDTDRERYFDEIESALSDFVDFREAARGVIAQYNNGPNGATADQLGRFAEVFRGDVLEFYGKALAAYDGEEYTIEDLGSEDTTANIGMEVTTDQGRVQLQYSMYIDDSGVWKMRNLYVEGVNLRRQYHSRFDSMMGRYNNDIDAVIENW